MTTSSRVNSSLPKQNRQSDKKIGGLVNRKGKKKR